MDDNTEEQEQGFDPATVTMVGDQPIVELDDAPDAYDWLATAELTLGGSTEEPSAEPEETEKSVRNLAVQLSSSRARLLSGGGMKVLATSQPLSGDFFEREVYVVDNEMVFARVLIDEPELVDVEKFDARTDEHGVSGADREGRWPGVEYLYLYPVRLLESYSSNPRPYRSRRN